MLKKGKWNISNKLLLLFCLIVNISPILPTHAQLDDEALSFIPLDQDKPLNFETNNHKREMPPNSPQTAGPAALSGDPAETDDFGYSWDDSIPVEWIDATQGINTEMSGVSAGLAHGPVNLGFDFPYYENNYNQIHIAASGYLSFNPSDSWPNQSQIPISSEPNNVIAPYWSPLYLSSGSLFGQVFYLRGGDAPDRFFVVEWYDVSEEGPGGDSIGDDNYHFQVILYENGDIRFQYQRMEYNGSSYCGAAGIENLAGEDGIAYLPLCTAAPSDRAVHFYRPEPSARMRLSASNYNDFLSPGETLSFQLTITNLGDLGEDTYELMLDSDWHTELCESDSMAPLADSNGDGNIDTGPIPQGESKDIQFFITAPENVVIGDFDFQTLTFTSSLDNTRNKDVEIRVAIPSRFAQSFRDNVNGAMSVMLNGPQVSEIKQVTDDAWWGYNPSIIQTKEGNFLYLWQRWELAADGQTYVSKLEYCTLDHAGRVIKAVTSLSGGNPNELILDEEPVLALTPSGTIGVAWRRRVIQNGSDVSAENWNIYFATIDGQGKLIQPAENLTRNLLWITSDFPSYGAPYFWNIRLDANTENHFALSWHRESHEEPAGSCLDDCKLNNIYFAILDMNGVFIKEITRFTEDSISSQKTYSSPTILALSGGEWALVYNHINGGMAYAILDKQGDIIRQQSFIPETGYGWSTVALHPIGGEDIIFAWTAWTFTTPQIHVLTIDADTFQPSSEVRILTHPQASTGGDFASLTPDALGNTILTWMDFSSNARQHLYYALLDNKGNLVTPPMSFYAAEKTKDNQVYVEAGYSGNSNTTNLQFVDVRLSHWGVSYIERMYDAGWTTGVSIDPPLYAPSGLTTRAEFAVFISRILEYDLPQEASGTIFADVSADYWAAPAIEKLYTEGLIKGCQVSPELNFCTEIAISRAETAVLLARILYGSEEFLDSPSGVFNDVPVDHWAAAAIEQLYRDGITTGCGTAPLRFCPDGSATRAEIAAFLVRTFDLP